MATKGFPSEASVSIGTAGYKDQVAFSHQLVQRKRSFGRTFLDDAEAGKARLGFFRYKQIQQTEHLLMDFEASWLKRGGKSTWVCSSEELAAQVLKISDRKENKALYFVSNANWKLSGLSTLLKTEGCELLRHTHARRNDPVIVCPDWGIASNGTILVDINDWHLLNTDNQILILSPYRILQDYSLIELVSGLKGIGRNGMPSAGNLTLLQPAANRHVIFYDFDHSVLAAASDQRAVLHCIECNACSDVCPVNQWIPESAWESPFTGPLAALLSNGKDSKKRYDMLNACTGCGACNEACPSNIPLATLMKRAAIRQYEDNPDMRNEKIPLYLWKNALVKRSAMERGGPKIKSLLLKQFLRKSWGNGKEIPVPAQKSFNQLWRERRGF